MCLCPALTAETEVQGIDAATHVCTPWRSSRHSAPRGWALSDRERHGHNHHRQAAVRVVGRKMLGTAAPRTASVSKMQGGIAASCTHGITPQPQVGWEMTPLQNQRGAAGKADEVFDSVAGCC